MAQVERAVGAVRESDATAERSGEGLDQTKVPSRAEVRSRSEGRDGPEFEAWRGRLGHPRRCGPRTLGHGVELDGEVVGQPEVVGPRLTERRQEGRPYPWVPGSGLPPHEQDTVLHRCDCECSGREEIARSEQGGSRGRNGHRLRRRERRISAARLHEARQRRRGEVA
jgi:hypothetical protein